MTDTVVHTLAGIPAPLLWGLAVIGAMLLLGTIAAVALPLLKPGKDWSNLRLRVWSWWVMIALVIAALFAGPIATTVLFAVISFLALREFLSLAPTRREDRLYWGEGETAVELTPESSATFATGPEGMGYRMIFLRGEGDRVYGVRIREFTGVEYTAVRKP